MALNEDCPPDWETRYPQQYMPMPIPARKNDAQSHAAHDAHTAHDAHDAPDTSSDARIVGLSYASPLAERLARLLIEFGYAGAGGRGLALARLANVLNRRMLMRRITVGQLRRVVYDGTPLTFELAEVIAEVVGFDLRELTHAGARKTPKAHAGRRTRATRPRSVLDEVPRVIESNAERMARERTARRARARKGEI
jgi:hypothetical protein